MEGMDLYLQAYFISALNKGVAVSFTPGHFTREKEPSILTA
jgi:hypothetical protein